MAVTPLLAAFLLTGLALNMIFFAQALNRFRKLEKQAGEKLAGWSRVSELSFMENRIFLALLPAFAVWCGWQIIRSPASPAGYRSTLVLLFVLANAPRWKVVVGRAGVVYRLRFIPWRIVTERTVVASNSRILLKLRFDQGPLFEQPKTLTIPVPKKVCLNLP
jgi:hypothetical protein